MSEDTLQQILAWIENITLKDSYSVNRFHLEEYLKSLAE